MNDKYDKFWELSVGKLHGENSDDENNELEDFLKDDEHNSDFKLLQNIQEKLPELKVLSKTSSAKSWNLISMHMQKRTFKMFIGFSKYAAAIILAFVLGNLISLNWLNNENEEFAEVSVPLGQMSAITLWDGTEVSLNSGTTLKYSKNFGNKHRNVHLNGEAFFKVKKSEIPFVVKLKNSEIRVLGTAFNAVSFQDEFFSQVTLVEGSVQLNTVAGKIITTLEPSQQITLSDDLKDIKLRIVNTDFYRSWTEGKIVFHEEKLSDIAERLERWYNVEIQLKDEETGNIRFSGTILKNKQFDQIMKAFELLLPVTIEYQNNIEKKDVVIISRK